MKVLVLVSITKKKKKKKKRFKTIELLGFILEIGF